MICFCFEKKSRNYENEVSNKMKDDIYLSELFDCVQQRRNYSKIWYKINNKYFS